MSELVEFLKARLDEREAHMEHLRGYEARTGVHWVVETRTPVDDSTETVRKIRILHPAQELADITAKRAIIGAYLAWCETGMDSGEMRDFGHEEGLEEALELLAQPYADHPDYNPAWSQS